MEIASYRSEPDPVGYSSADVDEEDEEDVV